MIFETGVKMQKPFDIMKPLLFLLVLKSFTSVVVQGCHRPVMLETGAHHDMLEIQLCFNFFVYFLLFFFLDRGSPRDA